MYDATDDPYTYENSTVLINKLDLRDQGELDDFEAEITNARAGEPLPEGNLDFTHFCAIHHHLFQDVFEWAGTPRTVRISKQGSAFCFPEHIDDQAAELNAIHAFQTLDFEKLDPDAMLHAMIASFDGDESELTMVIRGLLS